MTGEYITYRSEEGTRKLMRTTSAREFVATHSSKDTLSDVLAASGDDEGAVEQTSGSGRRAALYDEVVSETSLQDDSALISVRDTASIGLSMSSGSQIGRFVSRLLQRKLVQLS